MFLFNIHINFSKISYKCTETYKQDEQEPTNYSFFIASGAIFFIIYDKTKEKIWKIFKKTKEPELNLVNIDKINSSEESQKLLDENFNKLQQQFLDISTSMILKQWPPIDLKNKDKIEKLQELNDQKKKVIQEIRDMFRDYDNSEKGFLERNFMSKDKFNRYKNLSEFVFYSCLKYELNFIYIDSATKQFENKIRTTVKYALGSDRYNKYTTIIFNAIAQLEKIQNEQKLLYS